MSLFTNAPSRFAPFGLNLLAIPLTGILGAMTEPILLSGGDVVTTESITRADILIDGETIAAVGPHLDAPAKARRIDITGLTVLPGLLDVHTQYDKTKFFVFFVHGFE